MPYPLLGDIPALTVDDDYGQDVEAIPGFTPDVSAVTNSSTGVNVGGLIDNVLTDITQLIAPGTPSYRPLYTPTTTGVASVLSSPVALAGLAAAAYLLLRKGR